MKAQKLKALHSALFCLLVGLNSLAYPATDDAITETLPSCTGPSSGLRVLDGDTLTTISRRMAKPDEISDDEWATLVYEKNPNAFIENNRDLLSADATILFPCSDVDSSEIQKLEVELVQIKQLAERQVMAIRELHAGQTKTDKQLVEIQAIAQNARIEQPGSFMLVVIGLAGLILALLMVLSAYLYRWCKSFSTIAERALPNLDKIEQILSKLGVKVEKAESHNLQNSPGDKVDDGVSDASALRDYLKRLIPVDIAIDDFMRDGGAESKVLKVIKALTEDALDSCGVETFSPEIGEDYRRAEGVADYPKTRVTDKPEDKFKIVEVLEKGYRIKTPEGYGIIHPARVRIFTTE